MLSDNSDSASMASASTRVAEDGATSPSSSPSHVGVDQYFIAIGIDFGTT